MGDLEFKNNKKLSSEDQILISFPDVITETYTEHIKFIILACDGIWDCLTNQEVCDFINNELMIDSEIKLSKIIEKMFDSIISKNFKLG